MSTESALSTLAEVAIAIAGFSGIVAVFGRRSSGAWTTAERNRLIALIALSLIALFFSLAPFVLLAVPVSEATCWRVLSLLLASTRVYFLWRLLPIAADAARTPRAERDASLAVATGFAVGDLLATLLLVANALVWVAAWPYLATLVWVLFEAAVSFARLVVVPVMRGAES